MLSVTGCGEADLPMGPAAGAAAAGLTAGAGAAAGAGVGPTGLAPNAPGAVITGIPSMVLAAGFLPPPPGGKTAPGAFAAADGTGIAPTPGDCAGNLGGG
ncbi:MAG: hypothetical protein ABIJ56_18200 [Pseudomonadota bacterium]